MLDICLPGTGGMVPLKNRWLTCLYARCGSHAVLIDCGEGTQIALSQAECRIKPIDMICITPFHADHIAGIAGLLLSMGNAGRTEPVTICGPSNLIDILRALLVIAPALPFDIMVTEVSGETDQFLSAGDMMIHPFPVKHMIPCLGYTISVPRMGKFDPQRARELDIPVRGWKMLQKNEPIQIGDRLYTPDMVMGPPRKGIKVLYSTDTRPVPEISENGKDSDLMILEGIYGDNEKIDKAREWGHMTMPEAAHLGLAAQPGELWLTHYSPSMPDPAPYIDDVRRIFPRTEAGFDGRRKTIIFSDENSYAAR